MRDLEEEQSYYLIPKSYLKKIAEDLDKITQALKINGHQDRTVDEYVSEREAKKMLDRRTTWFWQMRNTGQLPFTKVGNKVFYKRSDIKELLDRGYSNDH